MQKSVVSALSQGILDCEVIIINDGSMDHTLVVGNEYAGKYGNLLYRSTRKKSYGSTI